MVTNREQVVPSRSGTTMEGLTSRPDRDSRAESKNGAHKEGPARASTRVAINAWRCRLDDVGVKESLNDMGTLLPCHVGRYEEGGGGS